jgi:hypothetical protein
MDTEMEHSWDWEQIMEEIGMDFLVTFARYGVVLILLGMT